MAGSGAKIILSCRHIASQMLTTKHSSIIQHARQTDEKDPSNTIQKSVIIGGRFDHSVRVHHLKTRGTIQSEEN
jgi:hypothetical protein